MANVTQLAKEIRKDGEAWKDALKRAAAQLKSESTTPAPAAPNELVGHNQAAKDRRRAKYWP
jgi:hypothetical protein